MSHYPPTPEQQKVIDLAMTGQDLKVIAFAGAGKTSTLISVARALPRNRILYLAFNKAIVVEAKEKFADCPNVTCMTFDALALAEVKKQYPTLDKKWRGKPLTFGEIVKICGNPQFEGSIEYTRTSQDGIESSHTADIHERDFLNYVYATLQAFLKSPHSHINKNHACSRFIERFGEEILKQEKKLTPLLDILVNSASRLWALWSDKKDSTPIGRQALMFDVIKKLWLIGNPNLSQYDTILYDEAQDANRLMIEVISRQPCQKIWVGDPHQQIYEWNGAKNALARIPAKACYITQSFRYGRDVASVANAVLGFLGDNNVLYGNDNKISTVSAYQHSLNKQIDITTDENMTLPLNAILMRTNVKLLEVAMELLKLGKEFDLLIDDAKIQKMIDNLYFLEHGEFGSNRPPKKPAVAGVDYGCFNAERQKQYDHFKKILSSREKVGRLASQMTKTMSQFLKRFKEEDFHFLTEFMNKDTHDKNVEERLTVIIENCGVNEMDLSELVDFAHTQKFVEETKNVDIKAKIAPKPMIDFQEFIANGIHDCLDLLCYCHRNTNCADITAFKKLIDAFGKDDLDELLEYAKTNRERQQQPPTQKFAFGMKAPTPAVTAETENEQEQTTPPVNVITLSTIHKSKGREWDTVLLGDDVVEHLATTKKGSNGAIIERIRTTDEEFRLLYVAMTRAKRRLYIPFGVATLLTLLQRTTLEEIKAYNEWLDLKALQDQDNELVGTVTLS